MQNRILIRSLLLFLVTTCVALALQSSSTTQNKLTPEQQIARDKRLIFFKKKKPGFFRTLFAVTFEQWRDTKDTISNISSLINDQFAPENAAQVETTTKSSEPNVSTTAAPYRPTRTELIRILSRNLRGLVRLLNIELQDALKASEQNWEVIKKNASLEVSKFL